MLVTCAWCGKTIKEDDGTGLPDSHGICEPCANNFYQPQEGETSMPPKMSPVDSSLIAAVGYDTPAKVLYVQFKKGGATYEYAEVPAEVYEHLMAAESIGKFFLKEIKGAYAGKKVEANG